MEEIESYKDVLKHVLKSIEENYTKTHNYKLEFDELKALSDELAVSNTRDDGWLQYNRSKNRYKDILPYDNTRVKLPVVNSIAGSDYINASHISGPQGFVNYIAAQGPLPTTIFDFWRMVWYNYVTVIVMVCKQIELGKEKCGNYWGKSVGEVQKWGNFTVTLISEQRENMHIVRTLQLKCAEVTREVYQYQFLDWPDRDVPSDGEPLYKMLSLVRERCPERSSSDSPDAPIVIHCSAGCGRTGTVLAIDYVGTLIKQNKLTEKFSVFELVGQMRRERVAICQTKQQYGFVYYTTIQLLHAGIQALELRCEAQSDSIYENVPLSPLPREKSAVPIPAKPLVSQLSVEKPLRPSSAVPVPAKPLVSQLSVEKPPRPSKPPKPEKLRSVSVPNSPVSAVKSVPASTISASTDKKEKESEKLEGSSNGAVAAPSAPAAAPFEPAAAPSEPAAAPSKPADAPFEPADAPFEPAAAPSEPLYTAINQFSRTGKLIELEDPASEEGPPPLPDSNLTGSKPMRIPLSTSSPQISAAQTPPPQTPPPQIPPPQIPPQKNLTLPRQKVTKTSSAKLSPPLVSSSHPSQPSQASSVSSSHPSQPSQASFVLSSHPSQPSQTASGSSQVLAPACAPARPSKAPSPYASRAAPPLVAASPVSKHAERQESMYEEIVIYPESRTRNEEEKKGGERKRRNTETMETEEEEVTEVEERELLGDAVERDERVYSDIDADLTKLSGGGGSCGVGRGGNGGGGRGKLARLDDDNYSELSLAHSDIADSQSQLQQSSGDECDEEDEDHYETIDSLEKDGKSKDKANSLPSQGKKFGIAGKKLKTKSFGFKGLLANISDSAHEASHTFKHKSNITSNITRSLTSNSTATPGIYQDLPEMKYVSEFGKRTGSPVGPREMPGHWLKI